MRKKESKVWVCEVSLGQRGGSIYGRGIRSCGPELNPRTYRDWLQFEPLPTEVHVNKLKNGRKPVK